MANPIAKIQNAISDLNHKYEQLSNTIRFELKIKNEEIESLKNTIKELEEKLTTKRNDSLISRAAEIVAQSANIPDQLDAEEAAEEAEMAEVAEGAEGAEGGEAAEGAEGAEGEDQATE